jgi:hypothetical protein
MQPPPEPSGNGAGNQAPQYNTPAQQPRGANPSTQPNTQTQNPNNPRQPVQPQSGDDLDIPPFLFPKFKNRQGQ